MLNADANSSTGSSLYLATFCRTWIFHDLSKSQWLSGQRSVAIWWITWETTETFSKSQHVVATQARFLWRKSLISRNGISTHFFSSKLTPNSQKGDLKIWQKYPLEKDSNQTLAWKASIMARLTVFLCRFCREHFGAFLGILTWGEALLLVWFRGWVPLAWNGQCEECLTAMN